MDAAQAEGLTRRRVSGDNGIAQRLSPTGSLVLWEKNRGKDEDG